MLMTLKYVVRNSNGGILGGYERRSEAEEAKRLWERCYERSPLVSGVKVTIRECVDGREVGKAS